MERARCPAHGLIVGDDGSCGRCRKEAESRNARSTYLVIGAGALVFLFALAAWRIVSTTRAASAAREPTTPATLTAEPRALPTAATIAPTTTGTRSDREARIAAAMRDVPVIVYTADYCGWCRKTKTWLDGRGIAYTEMHVDTDAAAKKEMLKKFGGGGIPAIDIEGELRRGYDPAWIERTLRARAEWRIGPG